MFPRGLIIAVVIGIIAGAIVGVLLVTQKNGEQLEFVLGPSISIVTEKLSPFHIINPFGTKYAKGKTTIYFNYFACGNILRL